MFSDSAMDSHPNSYYVRPFTFDLLATVLCNHSDASKDVILAKQQLKLLNDHLKAIEVQTVVVEENYVDRDYLEDFSAYYVKCFHEYKRYCKRLHFFSKFSEKPFTKDDIESLLQTGEKGEFSQKLGDSYVGFIVIRPLPNAIFGRACLKPYPSENRRKFPVKSINKINLFGLGLEVETLPFQEQDNVTAACATSALWSAFHATREMFHHKLLSPVEITQVATIKMPLGQRVFPNHGLTIEQMVRAVNAVGLDPHVVTIDSYINLKSHIYAYAIAGIPAILVLNLFKIIGGESIGLHAVTVTGYSLPDEISKSFKENGLNLVAEKMTKLYVHDDQVGPYARMEFIDESPSDMGWHLSTSFRASGDADVYAEPTSIIFPLHNKIRLPLTTPTGEIENFDYALTLIENAFKEEYIKKYQKNSEDAENDDHVLLYICSVLFKKREWDIRLITGNDLKQNIFAQDSQKIGLGRALLTYSLPRFLWHASAKTPNGDPLIDILFDATDIESGRYIRWIDIHDNYLLNRLNRLNSLIVQSDTSNLLCVAKSLIDKLYNRYSKDISGYTHPLKGIEILFSLL